MVNRARERVRKFLFALDLSVRMKAIYSGREIYISLSIRQLRLREDKEVGVDASSTGGVLVDARGAARRDKEASETKNMQTTALHASLTAHQTFIA